MKRNLRLFSALMVLVLCFSFMIPSHSFALNTLLVLSSTQKRVEIGNKIQIDVTIKNVNDLFGYEIGFSYPNGLVEFESITEGPFLKQKKQTLFEKTIDPQIGNILVSSALAGKNAGVYGDGILFTVVFRTRSTGNATFSMIKNNLWDSSLLAISSQSEPTVVEIFKIEETPIIAVEPAELDFGSVNFGETPSKTFQIQNQGKGKIEGEIVNLNPWIHVTPQLFDGPTEVTVSVTTTLLAPNDSYQGEVKVRSNAGEISVMIKIYIVQVTKKDPPTLKILTPDPETKSQDKRIFFLCETTPGCFASINNQHLAVDLEDGIFFMNTNLKEGKNDFEVAVWDAYENRRTQTITIYLDTTPPDLTVDSIPLFSNSDSLIITGKTEPNASLYFNSKALLVGKDGSFSVSYKAYNTINQLIFTSIDDMGNKRSAIRVFFYRPVLANTIILTVGSNTGTFNTREFVIDAPPILINGRVLVPLRTIAEIFGADILWKPETKKVNISLRTITIQLTVGNQEAVLNGRPTLLDSPPVINNGRVMVPLRIISEAFQSEIEWNQEEKNVIIRF
jgi:hypothetical protein